MVFFLPWRKIIACFVTFFSVDGKGAGEDHRMNKSEILNIFLTLLLYLCIRFDFYLVVLCVFLPYTLLAFACTRFFTFFLSFDCALKSSCYFNTQSQFPRTYTKIALSWSFTKYKINYFLLLYNLNIETILPHSAQSMWMDIGRGEKKRIDSKQYNRSILTIISQDLLTMLLLLFMYNCTCIHTHTFLEGICSFQTLYIPQQTYYFVFFSIYWVI